ncbi:MAG: ABC transporter substrate-binding protein [Alphaproteobacteria bacterium]|nr:ABC transporter substrate-binding protein [Alphaproteobacteria bacterium]
MRRLRALLRSRTEKPVSRLCTRWRRATCCSDIGWRPVGIDPDRDVVQTVMPPAETAAALREVRIDGCCAGAPSGDVAARAGFGRTVATLHTIWNHCPEKVFAVREEIAARPAEGGSLLRSRRECRNRRCDLGARRRSRTAAAVDPAAGSGGAVVPATMPSRHLSLALARPAVAGGRCGVWAIWRASPTRPPRRRSAGRISMSGRRALGLAVPACDTKTGGSRDRPGCCPDCRSRSLWV